ncbi:MAG: GTP 3',8-cyclase MoaA [Cyclobacteriaceae bacterium]
MLFDNHGRQLNYLRLAVTDRCNLRCTYCMPETGMVFTQKSKLLSYEEMERLVGILAEMGISKVRITGGEPLVRRDLIPFLKRLKSTPGIESVHMTTNGALLTPHLAALTDIGLDSINLSLDTLKKDRFKEITKRDEFDLVMEAFDGLVKGGFNTKINMVVIEGFNEDEVVDMAQLSIEKNVSVRFIEEMPFNGGGKGFTPIKWDKSFIHDTLEKTFGQLSPLKGEAAETAIKYQIEGAKGTIGIIPAYTRTICSQCDRVRLTPQGELRTCLYGVGLFSFRDFIRSGASDEDIKEKFLHFFRSRSKDGFESEKIKNASKGSRESMATIGG